MKHLYLLLFFYAWQFCGAQNRNPALDINRANIWRFGTTSSFGANDVPGLDFSNGTPVVINSGNNPPAHGATSISDDNGLQLYGGYQSIFDRTDNPLLNAGVVGDSGWIGIGPSNIAIPMPKSPNLIYYFSAQVTLKYTVVDMSLNNGMGQAILRNVQLEQYPVESKLAAVHHCNGSDVWIVGHRWETNTFYAYLLTDTGIITIPIVTSIGPVANAAGTFQGGEIKFSPNGKKLVFASFGAAPSLPVLFDFDKSTGSISNPLPLQLDTGVGAASFSPDNSKLYTCSGEGYIRQYDLNAGSAMDIVNSRRTIVKAFMSFSPMQIGRDGKIYVAIQGLPHSRYMAVIHKPNELDTLCQPEIYAVYLNGAKGYPKSLMNTIESFFYTGSSAYPCYGDTLTDILTISNRDGIMIRAHPNPFSDYTIIDVTGISSEEEVAYQLYDLLGREYPAQVTENNVWNGKQLHFYKARLPTGVYLLTVKTTHQSQAVKLTIL
ncbi:MAG: T9SS type A sorting domain-containing protein [Bacteroidetes bacterium]|nr:T9SS type A sorting domain-containing protein [Bacteroidota bacterium]MBK8657574.1 T9SS type A sorting domain-containing protein [Bacteroidota bacterium]